MKLSEYIDNQPAAPVLNEESSLINIKHGKDQITIDMRLKEIRYLKNVAKQGQIVFMPLSHTDAESYDYLFKNNKESLKSALAEDLNLYDETLKVKPEKMEFMTNPITSTSGDLREENSADIGSVINEDDTGIPYMAMGGVFTKDVTNLSKFVDIQDKMQVQKAIIDMFKLHPEVTDDMIGKLARNLKMEEPALENEIYAIMSSFFNKGKWSANPNVPIDPQQLQMGIAVESEHSDNPFIQEKIARDHLAEDSGYYTHLAEMEARYQGK